MIKDLMHADWYERITDHNGWRRVFWIAVVGALIAAVGWLVYATGGTTFVWAHSIYIPILLAAMLFRVTGAVTAAVIGGLMLGPWMPLDVAAGVAQPTVNWLYRLGILTLIGSFAGLLFTALDAQLKRMRRLAFEDIETNLPNRLSLELATQDMLHQATRGAKDRRVFVLSVQIPNFQEVETTLGPAAGRELMGDLADELDGLTSGNKETYRLGSDSFAMILPDATRRQCRQLAERILAAIEAPHMVEGIPVNLDAHIGLAAFPYHERDNAEMLIRKSVQALQMAVASGRRWQSYDVKRDKTRQEALALLGELKPALDRNELVLYYQPKVALTDGRVSGFEALIRWPHAKRGMVPPGLFIPGAERTGLIHPLTRWVLETAMSQSAQWRERDIDTRIAINVSGRNLADEAFVPWVQELFEEFSPPEGAIEFELTENSLLTDPGAASAHFDLLKRLGISLAIDDFGTGYSSLGYLQRLPVDSLKIDRSFIADLNGNGASGEIVRASIDLAHNLDMLTVAEGVETDIVTDELKRLACDSMQGYLCAKPMPAGQIPDWLASNGGYWRSDIAAIA